MSRNYQSLVPAGLIAAGLIVLPFVGKHDPNRLIAGLPCSILTENEIGSILGASVRLAPTDGHTCVYASTQTAPAQEVLVTVHSGTSAPLIRVVAANDGTQDAQRAIDALRLRFEERIAQVSRFSQAGR